MTTSTLSLGIFLLSSIAIGCGGPGFEVGSGIDPASDADPPEVEGGADTRLGTTIDGGPDASPEVVAEGGDAGPSAEAEVGGDAAPPPPTQKRVFVTSEAYTADMGGLAGADAKCQKLADAAKLGGVYKAFLSDSKTSAKTRLTHSTVPYKLVDGTTVALNWDDLTSSVGIEHAIDMTETGGKQTTASKDCGLVPGAWTNGGIAHSFSCEGWTSTTATDPTGGGVIVGRTDSKINWIGYCAYSYCATNPAAGWTLAFALYCFEQ